MIWVSGFALVLTLALITLGVGGRTERGAQLLFLVYMLAWYLSMVLGS